jgi:ribose-phosphate pyrophosphokinase
MPGAEDDMANPAIERVVVTDSVPPFRLTSSRLSAKVEVVPCAPLLAAAIARLATGAPLTDLLVF